jgi:hypothetical protein
MTLFNKIKWILGITMIFMLIVSTNLIDRNSFLQVRNSVETIYEDRLIAKDIIVSILQLIQEKELAVAVQDSTFFVKRNTAVNQQLETLLTQFAATELTKQERQILANFNESLSKLETMETEFVQNSYFPATALEQQLAAVRGKLATLSKIQLEEGRRQVAISRKALDTVDLFTRLEIYGLIILAVLVQILILYRPKQEEQEPL